MPLFDYVKVDGTVIEMFFPSSKNALETIIDEDGNTLTKKLSCPNLLGVSWGKISKQNTRNNIAAGKKGEKFWRSKNPKFK